LLQQQWSKTFVTKKQSFTIDLAETHTLQGNNGTRIHIPQGSIVSAFDQVEIYLDEAYNTMDMLKHQLTTTSNGQDIVSKGMIQLTCNDPNAYIHPNIPIEVRFPSNDQETSCDYFIGSTTSDGSINWVPQNQTTPSNTEEDNTPSFLYQNNNGNYLSNNIDNITSLTLIMDTNKQSMNVSVINAYDIQAAFSLDTNNQFQKFENLGFFPKPIHDKIIIKADVQVSGKLTNVQLTKGIHTSIDTVVLNAVCKSAPWVPLRIAKNSFKESTINIVAHIHSDKKQNLMVKKPFAMCFTKMRKEVFIEWKNMLNEYSKYSKNTTSTQGLKKVARGYQFNIKQFGWINCDYFPAKCKKLKFNFLESIPFNDPTYEEPVHRIAIYKNEKRILPLVTYKNEYDLADKPFDVLNIRIINGEFYATVSASNDVKNGQLIESNKKIPLNNLEQFFQENYYR
jgi:hypothetical protein